MYSDSSGPLDPVGPAADRGGRLPWWEVVLVVTLFAAMILFDLVSR